MKKKMPGKKKKIVQEENEISEKIDKKDSLKQIVSEHDFSIMGKSSDIRDSIFKIASLEPEPENNYLMDYIVFPYKSARDKSRFSDFFKELSEPKRAIKIEEPKVVESPNVQTPIMNPLHQNLRFDNYEKMPNVFSSNMAFNEMNFGGGENKFDNAHFANPDSLAQSDFPFFGRHGNSFSSKSTNTNTNTNNSNKRNSTNSLENNNVISFPGGDNTNNNINAIYNNSSNKTNINYIEKEKEFEPHVDISKVLSLEDKRSTIMIKNIPNKFTREKLLGLIDKNFEGAYDLFIMPKNGQILIQKKFVKLLIVKFKEDMNLFLIIQIKLFFLMKFWI